MSVKLVVSDVDGTLVDKEKKLTPGTIAAVKRLQAAGVGFTIISARPRSGMMPIADALDLDVPMGAFNGGTIFRRDGSVTCQHRIPRAVVEGVFAFADGLAVDRWVFADDRWYASSLEGVHVEHERIASNQEPVLTQDFTGLYDRADKVTFVSDAPRVLSSLAGRIGLFAGQATIVQSQVYYLDVTALAANKGDGIALLAEAMGVPLADTCAIGDQHNDLPMFARAGLSIAMGQGPAEVRAKAKHVTAGNDEDGVARAIDGIILAGR
ncbi:Cof-type HAD-IIB family hydrolase [Sphingomonas immobilis]|uniref:Cof-type HAD-IIB family hydrolase n=1 Tax=Sphingomonas immobilis TaxID=3063997 RepID=A0ABT8ZXF6_9SPHN|nr:Cof-type HAD-IIB family hydrolase [Sphingomonas sp. CA1-15]MDO7841700.1 Cof-type HAD-IIB family hydrolase [Sphingomonas sp. CA1-15]